MMYEIEHQSGQGQLNSSGDNLNVRRHFKASIWSRSAEFSRNENKEIKAGILS
jgi:hypothetical protein